MWGTTISRHAGNQQVLSVIPEVNIRESTLHTPQPSVNKVPILALKPRGDSPEVQNRGTSGPIKRTCVH